MSVSGTHLGLVLTWKTGRFLPLGTSESTFLRAKTRQSGLEPRDGNLMVLTLSLVYKVFFDIYVKACWSKN